MIDIRTPEKFFNQLFEYNVATLALNDPYEIPTWVDHEFFYFSTPRKIIDLVRELGTATTLTRFDEIGISQNEIYNIYTDNNPLLSWSDRSISEYKNLSKKRKQWIDTFVELNNIEKHAEDKDHNFADRPLVLSGDMLTEHAVKEFKNSNPIVMGRFEDLNARIPSFNQTEVMIVGGRNGTGKTTFALQLVDEICRSHKETSLFFSLEMSLNLLLQRFLTVRYWEENIYHGNRFESNRFVWQAKNNKDLLFSVMPKTMAVCDKTGLTLRDIKRISKDHISKHKDCKTIVIDYLGLIKSENASRDRRSEVSAIAAELRSFARDFNIRLVMISQLRRSHDKSAPDGYCEPRKDDLKESGDIEDVSDLIIGLWLDSQSEYILNASILKARSGGGEGLVKLARYGTYLDNMPQTGDMPL